MDAERKDMERARHALESASGLVVRATRRGALVLETENARRMMRRLAQLRPGQEPEPPEDAETATARP
jgi:hypothetical protein